ncbi:MAG: apolipoprotein N-acyltransferase [Gammaproteobacteria bacterium]
MMVLKLILSFLLGSSLVLAFEPFNFWFLSFFSPIFAFYLIVKADLKQSILIGWFFGFGLWVNGIFWIENSIHDYGGANIISSYLLTVILASFLALFFALIFFIFTLIKQNNSFDLIFLFPSIWVLGEWLREFLLSGFPWLYIGYTALDNYFISGLIPVLGVFGMSFIILFISANTLFLVSNFKTIHSKKILIPSTLSLILIFSSSIFFFEKEWTKEFKEIEVVVVQPNISIEEKWGKNGEQDALKLFKSKLLGESGRIFKEQKNQKLIFWPEAFLPGIFSGYKKTLSPFLSFAKKAEIGVIVGTLSNSQENSNEIQNSLISFGILNGQFDKQKLVPFGEYVPHKIFNYFFNFFSLNRPNITPSENNKLIESAEIIISSAICYEIAYQDIYLKHSKSSNLLFNASNDNWFGDSIGPHQHLQISRYRAAEHRKPLIRSTSTGISAVIDIYGNIVESLPIDEMPIGFYNPETIETNIVLRKGQTPFALIGKLPFIVLIFLVILICIYQKIFINNEKN